MRYTGFLSIFLLMFTACDNGEEGRVQDVFVNFKAPINDPRIRALNSAGGAVTIEGHGVAGLILYRAPDGRYLAYDRCSTVDPEKKCKINVDDPSLTATDPCSGAKFSLSDGSPVKAPAKRALKQYQVVVTSFDLSVIN